MAGGFKHPLLANPVPGDVYACIVELGIQISKVDDHGDEVQGWCPAHEERTGKRDNSPSWSVNTDSGMHNCFSCGFRGSFASLVKYVLDCSWSDALAWCRKRGGIEKVRKHLNSGYIDELAPEDPVTEADLALFLLPPLDELDARNIDPEAADDYEILWDDEHDRWIFPIRDPYTNELWGWQEKNKRIFINVPKKLTKSKTLFGLNVAQHLGLVVIIVESPLDCARIRSVLWDEVAVVATMGAEISDAQIDLLCEFFDVVVSAMDNDEAGEKTNAELRERFGGRVRLRFWNYDGPEKDPGAQSDDQIEHSFDTAYSAVVARW